MREDRRQEPRRLGDVIATLMKSAVKPQRGDLARLCEAWVRAVGAEAARRSRPMSFRNGELRVGFESSALRHEVESYRKAEILARLQAEVPDRRIAALKCVLRG